MFEKIHKIKKSDIDVKLFKEICKEEGLKIVKENEDYIFVYGDPNEVNFFEFNASITDSSNRTSDIISFLRSSYEKVKDGSNWVQYMNIKSNYYIVVYYDDIEDIVLAKIGQAPKKRVIMDESDFDTIVEDVEIDKTNISSVSNYFTRQLKYLD